MRILHEKRHFYESLEGVTDILLENHCISQFHLIYDGKMQLLGQTGHFPGLWARGWLGSSVGAESVVRHQRGQAHATYTDILKCFLRKPRKLTCGHFVVDFVSGRERNSRHVNIERNRRCISSVVSFLLTRWWEFMK